MNHRPRVLRVCHSAVVRSWRQRERALRDEGVDATLIAPRRWNEGGELVDLEPDPDEAIAVAGTLGHHPFLFVYNPFPIWRLLRRNRFELLDVHEEPASLALSEVLVIARLARVRAPVVCYSAQNIAKRYPIPFRWLERFALRRVHAVHTCNNEVVDVLRGKGFHAEVANLGLGTDLEQFSPSGRTPSPEVRADNAEFRIGFIGRLEEFKGIFTLLAAARGMDGAQVTFVGGGSDEDRLRQAVDARGLDDRARVRGFVPFDQLPDLYRGFDVVVVPTHERSNVREQFGRVVVEAMACGIPVIVSDVGALGEVAGGAALVVPPRDAAALRSALADLRDHPSRRAELAARGLARATHYSWRAVAQRQASLYDRVIRGEGDPATGVG